MVALKIKLESSGKHAAFTQVETPGPEVIEEVIKLLNSAEHEFFHAKKSQITNSCKFFLAKQS